MALFEQVDFGSTRIDAVSGVWTRELAYYDPGGVGWRVERLETPLIGGGVNLHRPVPSARSWSLTIRSKLTGSMPTSLQGAIADEVLALAKLYSTASGDVTIKLYRKDAAGSTISKVITAEHILTPSYNVIEPNGGAGPIGDCEALWIDYVMPFYSRWPWWQQTTPSLQETMVNAGSYTLTNDSDQICGVQIDCVSITGTPSITITNTTMDETTTFSPISGDVYDFFYTNPNEMSFPDGRSPMGMIRLQPGDNTITVAAGGATIDLDARWKGAYSSP